MSIFESFVVGDRVLHSSRGEGVVTEMTGEAVTVQFFRTNKKGEWLTGVYPRHWFEFARERWTSLHNLTEDA